jgi:hypothetical protein
MASYFNKFAVLHKTKDLIGWIRLCFIMAKKRPRSKLRDFFRRFLQTKHKVLARKYKHKKVKYKSATSNTAQRLGRGFLESFERIEIKGKKRRIFVVSTSEAKFESDNSIALQTRGLETEKEEKLAEVKLGFESNAVIVEAIQGFRGMQPELERFREMHGKPWANYLIEKVEKHAKKLDFSKVKIRIPESLYYYQYPYSSRKTREIREKMVNLYYGVAKARGYRRKGRFFVKRLN